MQVRFQLVVLVVMLAATSTVSAAWSVRERGDRIRAIVSAVLSPEIGASVKADGKCGTKLSEAVTEHWSQFTLQQQSELRTLMSPQEFQRVRLIGRFEIHYDTSGEDAPAMLDANRDRILNSADEYADSVARYFNYAYAVEVDSLHFTAPPVAPGHIGYEIDIRELNLRFYGQTVMTDRINPDQSPGRYFSYIEVDNDFREFTTFGMAGLRVTSAHEFHHMIQFGSYAFWGQNYAWFHEITSTWMEDVVHTDVNDYYNYLRTPSFQPMGTFQFPEYSFTRADALIEYSRAVFGKYIEQRFSAGMMRRIWEEMRTSTVLPAMNRALADSGSSFQKAFLEWTMWNYYTGHRADTIHYYHEGRQYPEINERDTTYYFSPAGSFHDTVQSLGSAYHPVLLNGTTRLFTIVSNVNASALSPFQPQPFTFLMADTADGSYKHLDSLIYVKIDVADPINWKSQESVPSVPPVVSSDGEAFVYPNPFRRLKATRLIFAVPPTAATTGHLIVFSSGMRKVLDADIPITSDIQDRPSLQWDMETDTPASGIYVYYATVGDRIFRGKFAIIR